MEEGGGHGFFVLVVFLEEGEGEEEGEEEEGEEEDVFSLLLVLLLLGFLLVGWLFFLGLLFKRGTFLVSTFFYHAGCGYAFFFFSLSLFFSWLSWRGGWIMHLRVVPID